MIDTITLKQGEIVSSHYYSQDEILSVLDIAKDTLGLWIETGLGFTVTGPQSYLVAGEDIIRYIKENKVIRKVIPEGYDD